MPPTKRLNAADEGDEMLRQGIIDPSNSPWSSSIVLVDKKDGTYRFCVDFRKLNVATRKDAYPLLRTDDLLDELGGNKWFSTLNLARGYWQVEMDPIDKEKTAFTLQGEGLFYFNVMCFGLTNAPATFECLLERVLLGLMWKICVAYLDDIICYGNSFDSALIDLKAIFQRLREAGLRLKPKKCKLLQQSFRFFGHFVSTQGVAPDPDRIQAVRDWSVLQTEKEVHGVVGFTARYRKFINSSAQIMHPITELTEKKKFIWTSEC